jgi:hypothetical protein
MVNEMELPTVKRVPKETLPQLRGCFSSNNG